MSGDRALSWLEQALLHLELIDETSGLTEARLHAHFAKLFLQLEYESRPHGAEDGPADGGFAANQPHAGLDGAAIGARNLS